MFLTKLTIAAVAALVEPEIPKLYFLYLAFANLTLQIVRHKFTNLRNKSCYLGGFREIKLTW